MEGTDFILEAKNISKDFGAVRALHNVSFGLPRGKILGLVGDNGAGKSTLLKILSGALQPSSGEVYLEGERVWFRSTADAMKRGIAIAYQFLELVDIAKVWQNFFMGRELRKSRGLFSLLDVEGMRRLTAEAIAKHGHVLDVEREVKELSGGQRGILFISRALEAEPKVLLLDEPTHGLSKRVIDEIFTFLRKIAKERGVSILITSQWFELISSLVDEVMVMRRGSIVGYFDMGSAKGSEIFKLAMGLTV
jgi:simple sugar transport system ATP-binding protein